MILSSFFFVLWRGHLSRFARKRSFVSPRPAPAALPAQALYRTLFAASF
jgi:hypothetical protein